MVKMNKLDHSLKFVSNPGNRFKIEYHAEVLGDGSITLVEDRVIDLVEMMQCEAVGCTVKEIVTRAINGDPTVWRDDAFYADMENMPKSYAEALNMVNNAKLKFMSLPVEVREKFGHNFEKWFVTFGTDEWKEKIGMNENQREKEKVSESNES